MAFTWYGNQTGDEGCNLGSLAVVWPLLERMNVAGIIDRHLPADPQAEFSHGTILSLLVAARLYSPVALSNLAEWAGEAGADILWDMPLEYTLNLQRSRYGRIVYPTRLSARQREILAQLGFPTPAQILCRRLARPPPD